MLKLKDELVKRSAARQPPSGGCVLKPQIGGYDDIAYPSRLQAAVC